LDESKVCDADVVKPCNLNHSSIALEGSGIKQEEAGTGFTDSEGGPWSIWVLLLLFIPFD
jgi:hypothetical protein